MREYEASARTVEEAIEQGLQELGVSIGDVDVRVVEEGSKTCSACSAPVRRR